VAFKQSRVAEDLAVFFDFMRVQHGKSLHFQIAADNTTDYSLL